MIGIVGSELHLWRNPCAAVPVLMAELRLSAALGWTVASLPGAAMELLRARFSGLPPLPETIDLAQLTAEIAQQFQRSADITAEACGVADRKGDVAHIFFAARQPHLARVALSAAVQIVNAMTSRNHDPVRFARLLDTCANDVNHEGFDQSSRAMIAAAEARGIPWRRLTETRRHVLAGQGARQIVFRETMTGRESALARELARSKLTTFKMLAPCGVPVGRFALVENKQAAFATAGRIGYPVVLKPLEGMKGQDVHANLRDERELAEALDAAPLARKPFLLQSFFPGEDYRLLVVGGRLIAAARRTAAHVIGDGVNSIARLVEIANRDPRRGKGFEKLMVFLTMDDETVRVLAKQGLKPQDVPAEGRHVRLRSTANIATGGISTDVTDIIHPDNVRVAIRATQVLGLDVTGVDLITPDISRSWREMGGGVCEVNLFPGLRAHYLANPSCDVAGPIIETMFPPGDDGRIPVVMIAGPGAGDAAIRMGRILTEAGHVAGVMTGDKVMVGAESIEPMNEVSGMPQVLCDPAMTAAVLGIAAGSLRKGVALDRCDVVAVMPGTAWADPAHAAALFATARRRVVLPADAPVQGAVETVTYADGDAMLAAIAAALGIEGRHVGAGLGV